MNRILVPVVCLSIVVSGCETTPKTKPVLIASTEPMAGPETPVEKQPGYWSHYTDLWSCKKDAATCKREADERRQSNRKNLRMMWKVLGGAALVFGTVLATGSSQKRAAGAGGDGSPGDCNTIATSSPFCPQPPH